MKELFDKLCEVTSKITTQKYSTSFSLGIKFLSKDLQQPIYNIYGFVRFADEIVDTFHDYDKKLLLDEFKEETHKAIDRGISLNPILNSFQATVRQYNIPKDIIDTFLYSMEMDLTKEFYNQEKYEQYILGSAEVVGLMCLKVFVRGDEAEYERLKSPAMKLGSAFQKINFLRDLKADYHELGRTYFPGVDLKEFNDVIKKQIEADIALDFELGYNGIMQLPKNARFGTYMAYIYYYKLFKKIKETPAKVILNQRIRIPNNRKYGLFISSYLRHSLNLV
ncbi:Phytoene/squalene synthetase [Lishizhenia tianjinensis]|uniref:Phytoene/squalene synthetase n=1 Tax=Lishizhenia tianjinensis TaxID=477690 RepID=A0A1I7BVX8_9FLAO|nr:phytoene/squalene synthase family protein [Lishizhenia tianjinensis]SFT91343.1 Phytoene/squalene synthetase [Lishizhenia tianjinensis]